MKTWAIFPSGNSAAAQLCAKAWDAAGWRVGVLIDADQPDVFCDLLVREENYRGTGAAFNKLIGLLSAADLFACVNDDMFPVKCAAHDVERIYQKQFPNLDGVLQPTGIWFDAMAWCAPCPIIGRGYVERMQGKPWDEGFYHLFGDQWLRSVAIEQGRYCTTSELGIEHRHKSLGFVDTLPADKRARNNERHAADERLYHERLKARYLEPA